MNNQVEYELEQLGEEPPATDEIEIALGSESELEPTGQSGQKETIELLSQCSVVVNDCLLLSVDPGSRCRARAPRSVSWRLQGRTTPRPWRPRKCVAGTRPFA